jgi:bifunctional non-homologous end joining protein LigD
MAKKTGDVLRVGTRDVPVTNLQKVLYPAAGFTKHDVIDYYLKIAPVLLPHLKGRPITLKRYPNGVSGMFFYEKHCPDHKPAFIKTIHVPQRTSEPVDFCAIDTPAALVWLANLASLEIHPMLQRKANLARPTMLVFDFDPGAPAGFVEAAEVAIELHDLLGRLGLESCLKTSGSKGVHLFVPLNTAVTFEQTKDFARAVATLLEQQDPDRVTTNMRKDLRTGKVFVDWSQNDTHKTTVAPYSLRAREQPTVSTPVTIAELTAAVKKKKTLAFTAPEVLKRVEKLGDLFAPMNELKQKLPTGKI